MSTIDLSAPTQIGKFPVIRPLGVGAMGEVFLCMQPELERQVAVKVMRGGRAEWPRFQREARSAARLVHPNVVRVYDVGLDHDRPYIVMEFIDGRPLSELIGTPYLTLPVTLRLLYHIAEALQAAHRQSIIHRDLKPSNILIDTQGRPHLTDFGLAKSLLQDPTLSGTGDLIGTPRYMAPEQILGDKQELDQRGDLFSLGVVMYEMLAGRPPFDGPTVVHILRQVADDDPPNLSDTNQTIPAEVIAICAKAMAKRPEDRFTTAAEFSAALRTVLLADPTANPEGSLSTGEYLAAFVPPTSTIVLTTEPLPWWRRWLTHPLTAGLGVAVVMGLLFWNWPAPPVIEDEPPALSVDFAARRARLLPEVALIVRGELRVPQNKAPRDVLKEALDDATALVKQAPADLELRLARVRLLRRTGECLAAEGEATAILAEQPSLEGARIERVLARWQLWGLYLGAWEDAVLRYPVARLLTEDLAFLKSVNDPHLQGLAGLLTRLTTAPGDDLLAYLKTIPVTPHEDVAVSDMRALQVELLHRAAEDAPTEVSPDEPPVPTFAQLDNAARPLLRVGLEQDPYHLPLLFIRANSYTRRVGWFTGDHTDDRWQSIQRSLPQFDNTNDRLRRVTLRQGCDSYVARAVLLMNRNQAASALDQLDDALSCTPTVSQLEAVRTWFRFFSPEDGTHTAESLDRLSRAFREVSPGDEEEYLADFVRGLLAAATGRFAEARRELRACRRKLADPQGWPGISDEHRQWLEAVEPSETAFLLATRPILGQLPITLDTSVQLHEELLARFDDDGLMRSEGWAADQVRDLRATVHFTFAETYANLEARDQVLEQLEAALEAESPAITSDSCRDHWRFGGYNQEEEFLDLYARFPVPVMPAEATDDEPMSPDEPTMEAPTDTTEDREGVPLSAEVASENAEQPEPPADPESPMDGETSDGG
jgi:predicted Ser/Thr protein kinase/tetratricopeptide (TPR) repeat protein